MRRVIALVACVAAVGFGTLAAGASAVAQTAPEAASDIPEYKLGSGDKVRVTTFGEQNLTGEFQVSGTGKIALPLVGEIDALGLTAPQLAGIAAVIAAAFGTALTSRPPVPSPE